MPKKKAAKGSSRLERKAWTIEEDNLVSKLVEKYGSQNWSAISEEMNHELDSRGSSVTRTGKQIRTRWLNHLDPTINKDPWTEREEDLLATGVTNLGHKWAQVSGDRSNNWLGQPNE